MNTVAAVFDALGGPAAVARMLEVNASTASEMKRRGSIPNEHWVRLVTEAAKHGRPEVTYEALAVIHAAAKGKLPAPEVPEAARTLAAELSPEPACEVNNGLVSEGLAR